MITTLERDEFVRKVEGWRGLCIEDQENVISNALERCELKSRNGSIPNRVGWLLGAASLIKREVGRVRKRREKTHSAIIEIHAIDRHRNGAPTGLPRAATPGAERFDGRSEREQICREVLDSLSPIDRQIAELCVIQGLQPAEAGRLLSLSRSTTKSRRDRLILKLRSNPTLQQLISSSGRTPQ